MSETFFDTCVNWSCVTRCRCRTTSSTLFIVYTVYTYTVCNGGGGKGFWVSERSTPAAKLLYRSILLCRWRHFALPSMSLIFLRVTMSLLMCEVGALCSVHCKKFLRDSWIYFDQTLQGLCVFYVYKGFFLGLLFLFKERSFPVYSMWKLYLLCRGNLFLALFG